MAIKPFQRKFGVSSGIPLTRVQQVNIPDIGPQLQRLGGALSDVAYQQRADKAKKQAKDIVNELELRDPETGNLISELPDLGGGEIFKEEFKKLFADKYVTQFNYDFQLGLRNLAKENSNNPDAFRELASEYLQVQIENAPADLRTSLLTIGTREFLEQERSVSNAFQAKTNRELLSSTLALVDLSVKQYQDFLVAQDYEKAEEAKQRAETLLNGLKGVVGDSVIEAELEKLGYSLGNVDQYISSIFEGTPVLMQAITGAETFEELNIIEQLLRGIAPPDVSIPVTRRGEEKQFEATPEFARSVLEETIPGVVITSGQRELDDPTIIANPASAHSVANGGRAFDIRPISGMSFAEFIVKLEQAGFNITNALDETSPEVMRRTGATGPHWHIEYGPRITRTEVQPDPNGLTINRQWMNENLSDRGVRNQLLTAVTEQKRKLNEGQVGLARRANAIEEVQEQQRTLNNINEKVENNITDYNSDERKTLNEAFNEAFGNDFASNENRVNVIGFITQYNYLPSQIVQWISTNVRNPNNWESALNFYNDLKNMTSLNGSNIGDLYSYEFNARERSLLNRFVNVRSFFSPEEMSQYIQDTVRNDIIPTDNAISQYNVTRENNQDSFNKVRTDFLQKEFFNGDSNTRIPPSLSNEFNNLFAANLGILGDIEEALEETQKDILTQRVPSGIFRSGVGFASFYQTLGGGIDMAAKRRAHTRVLRILQGYKSTRAGRENKSLVGREESDGIQKTHTIGGPNSTIKIIPLDGSVRGLGRYQVLIMDPFNPQRQLESKVIDFTEELGNLYQRELEEQRSDTSESGLTEEQKETLAEEKEDVIRREQMERLMMVPGA